MPELSQTESLSLRLRSSLFASRSPLLWLLLAPAILALALAPLPALLLAACALALLPLLAHQPLAGLLLAVLSVPAQDLVRLPGGLSLTQFALLLALAGWGLAGLLGRAGPPRADRLLLPWLLFLWALLLATARTPFSTAEALKETLRWLVAFVVWLMTVSLVRRRWQLWALVACLLLAPAAEAALGLAQFVGGYGPPSFRLAAGLPFVRAYGTIGQPNSFAGYLNMAWPLALALAVGLTLHARGFSGMKTNDEGRMTKCMPGAASSFAFRPWSLATQFRLTLLAALGAWLIVTLLLAALLASFSRGAWLGALAGLAAMALALGGRARLLALAALGAGVLALALGGAGLLPGALAERLRSVTSYLLPFDAGAVTVTRANYALVERMAQVQAGWRMLLAHPLSGVGPGNFSSAYPGFAVGAWYVSRGHAHNYYVHIAAEAGLLGLAAYLALIGALLARLRAVLQSVQTPLGRGIAIGCCGIIAAVLGHDLFENLHVLSMGIQLAAVWGLLGALEEAENRPQIVLSS